MKNEKSNITNSKVVLSDNYLVNTMTKLLMKEKPVAILGFGYLETKELSGKKTVLYKTADSGSPVMKDFYSSNTDSEFITLLQEKLSAPLKIGKTVLIEEIGTFNPMKNPDGSFRLSFIPASSLRDKLNGNEIKLSEKRNKDKVSEKREMTLPFPVAEAKGNVVKKEEVSLALPVEKKQDNGEKETIINNKEKEQDNLKESVKKDEFVFPPIEKAEKKEEVAKPLVLVKSEKKGAENQESPIGKNIIASNTNGNLKQTPEQKIQEKPKDKIAISSKPMEKKQPITSTKTSSVGKVLFDDDSSKSTEKKKKKKLLKWTILSIVFVIVVFVCIAVVIENKEDKQESVEVEVGNEEKAGAFDLFSLSERYYGNSIFWVYIYEANQDKLKSPINIPHDIDLVIPDLTEKEINTKDSVEIKYAKMKADIILNKKQR